MSVVRVALQVSRRAAPAACRGAYKEKAPHRRGALGKGIPVQQQRVRSVRLFYGGFRVISVSGASGE
jgi:hypothetical protein